MARISEVASNNEEFYFLSSEDSQETDLSIWELINPSDAEDDGSDDDVDNISIDSIKSETLVSWHSSSSSSTIISQNNQPQIINFDNLGDDDDDDQDVNVVVLDDHEKKHVSFVGIQSSQDDGSFIVGNQISQVSFVGDQDDEDEGPHDDDEDEDGDGYDLDDELVPWSVSDKFGRQRMRKLGKRVFTKMNNSKRSPFLYLKPGCVHGKHGLGLKHSC